MLPAFGKLSSCHVAPPPAACARGVDPLERPYVPPPLSQEAADLMEQCTRLDPSERPTALEAMKRLHAMVAAGRTAPATVAPSVTSTGG